MNKNDQETARAVLGAVLLDNSTLDILTDKGVSEKHFESAAHKEIFTAFQTLKNEKLTIDYLTVENRISKSAYTEMVTTTESVPSIAESSVSSYCDLLLEGWRVRRCRTLAAELEHASTRDGAVSEDLEKLISDCQKELHVDTESSCSLSDAVNAIERYQSGTVVRPYCGYDELEQYMPYPPRFVVLAARPSMGKTSFATYLADQWSRCGYKSAIWTLEETEESVWLRLIGARTGITIDEIQTPGKLGVGEFRRITQAAQDLSKLGIIIKGGSERIAKVESWIRKVVKKDGVRAIFIDHLGLMPIDNKREEAELGAITCRLAALSKELSIVIVLIHQLNRSLEARDNKRPMMSDLRGSGRIEQDADMVWFLYRHCYYSREGDPNEAEVLVRKNRHGPTGDVIMPVALWCGSWGDEAVGFLETLERSNNDSSLE